MRVESWVPSLHTHCGLQAPRKHCACGGSLEKNRSLTSKSSLTSPPQHLRKQLTARSQLLLASPPTANSILEFSSMHGICLYHKLVTSPSLLGICWVWSLHSPPHCGQTCSCSPYIILTFRRDPINHSTSFHWLQYAREEAPTELWRWLGVKDSSLHPRETPSVGDEVPFHPCMDSSERCQVSPGSGRLTDLSIIT